MTKIKNDHKTDSIGNIIVKNIYKEKKEDTDNKIQEILLKSYKIFIQKEWKEVDKCLQN